MIILILVGLLPLFGIFGFAFAMAFVKVHPPGNAAILQGEEKVSFAELKKAIEEQINYKKRQLNES